MARYVTLINWTDQGIKDVKDSPKRLDAAKEAITAAGGRLIFFYLLMGEYDGDKFNFGVRAGLTPEIRVELGSYDSDFGGGISYRAKF